MEYAARHERGALGRSIVFLARLRADEARKARRGWVLTKTPPCSLSRPRRPAGARLRGQRMADRAAPLHAVLVTGQPLTIRNVHIVQFGPDSILDRNAQTVSRPLAETNASIERGKPADNRLLSRIMLCTLVPPDET